jgi:hypothetical protein
MTSCTLEPAGIVKVWDSKNPRWSGRSTSAEVSCSCARILESGKKVRYLLKTGEVIDKAVGELG